MDSLPDHEISLLAEMASAAQQGLRQSMENNLLGLLYCIPPRPMLERLPLMMPYDCVRMKTESGGD